VTGEYRAVVFDLFGTLVDDYAYDEYQRTLEQAAALLHLPLADFRRVWFETTDDRNTGVIPTINANMALICQRLGRTATDAEVAAAARVRHDFTHRAMAPRADAVSTLAKLRARGLKIGLISNCSPDAPQVWPTSPLSPFFDTAVFSASCGVMKPNVRIYELALQGFQLPAAECLYVGDGDSQELTGAATAGMHPVMIRVAGQDRGQPPMANRQLWDGPVISSLAQVLALV